MKALSSRLFSLYRNLFHKSRVDRELKEEIDAYAAMLIDQKIAEGLEPREAHRAAMLELEGRRQVMEQVQEARMGGRIESLGRDVRYAFRMFARNPGFALTVVVTLSLGIGANASIFSLLDKALIRPLPVERPDQLVTIATTNRGGYGPGIFSYPLYVDLRDRNQVLSGLVAYFQQPFSLSDGDQSERVIGQIVSGNYFDVIGVRPALGRFFLPEEDRTPGTHPVAVISQGLWRRRFGADPAVLGKTVGLNGRRYTVVGVAPSEFRGTTRGTVNDVYVPTMMQAEAQPGANRKLDDPNSGWLRLMGRLKPEIRREQAQAALSILAAEDRASSSSQKSKAPPPALSLMDGSRGYTDRVKDLSLPLKLLMGVVGFVLLIACANVANLLLARASARRKEIAVRLAIGASRRRIVRQLLTESAILAALGGGGGLLVASWLNGLLLGIQQQTNFVPRTLDDSLDGRVLWFTLGLSLLTAVVFGLAPALQASKPDFVTALKEDAGGSGGGTRRWSLRNLLVVSQVALSLVVLIGAGLCVKSLRTLQAVDPGFEPAKVVTASFDLSKNGYDQARGRRFISDLTQRVAALPGVEVVSFGRIVAFSASFWIMGGTPEGYQAQPGERLAFDYNAVSPNYFRTLGAALVQGREFTTQDTADAPPVIVINEATARRYWSGQAAVGKRIQRGHQFAEIVGVVKNSREKGLTVEPVPAIYLPLLQNYTPELTLHVRTATEARTMLAAVRREAQALDANLPLYDLRTLAEQRDGSLYAERMAATLLTLFGALALVLAAIGLYGVLSYSVTERKREMGIRLALGARPRDLLRLVVGQGMLMTLIGLCLGVGASLALTRFLGTLLFGVTVTDPLTFALLPLLLGGVAALACWLPARRATRVDPLTALRAE
jgi:macrolide transport system ATP-binding/permease protein